MDIQELAGKAYDYFETRERIIGSRMTTDEARRAAVLLETFRDIDEGEGNVDPDELDALAESLRDYSGPDTEPYETTTEAAPDWLDDLCRSAHSTPSGLMWPDDHRYRLIRAALGAIHDDGVSEDGSHDFADSQVDVYTSERVKWLASHDYRQGYCDDAARDLGTPEDLVTALGYGQYAEAMDVYTSVLEYLTEQADEDGSDDDTDDES